MMYCFLRLFSFYSICRKNTLLLLPKRHLMLAVVVYEDLLTNQVFDCFVKFFIA